MNGVLIIDKPSGMTSHDVVDRVRRVFKTRRVGHTGTLDPFATGVMVILLGKATRLAQFLDKDEKEYEAVVRFGFETETGDRTGKAKTKGEPLPLPVRLDDVDAVLPKFIGEIRQVPPMYSAKKIGGTKLYEHARKGVAIERECVTVKISELQIVDPQPLGPDTDLKLHVVCSAGTYVRALAEDIARQTSTAAHLAELRRTRSGRFCLKQSVTLDELEKMDEPSTALLPVGDAVTHLPALSITDDRVEATTNGLSTRIEATGLTGDAAARMVDRNGNLLAIGIYDKADGSIRPKVVLV